MDAPRLKEMLLEHCKVPEYSPLYLQTLPELQHAVAGARGRVDAHLEANPAWTGQEHLYSVLKQLLLAQTCLMNLQSC